MECCIEIAMSSSTWTEEAVALAQFRLSMLYLEQGTNLAAAKELRSQSLESLDRYRGFVTDWVLELNDPLLALEDLQPTREGRFVEGRLLAQLWKRRELMEGAPSMADV